MDLGKILSDPLAAAKGLQTKKVVKQFAHKFDMVYFGYVDQTEDEHQLIRGITLSAEHTDNHFTVGSFKGRDITLVQRSDHLTFPNQPKQHYTWMILQVDLQTSELPHIFIDANHHDSTFYANLFVKFTTFANFTPQLVGHDSLFAKSFKAYTPSDKTEDSLEVLTPAITSMLAYHFRHFDFEIFDDQVLVYASNALISLTTLQDMLRVGVWLASELDKKHGDETKNSPDSEESPEDS